MAKSKKAEAAKSAGTKKTFEERLLRLEELGDEIRKNDVPLDDAIKAFEEGIQIARGLEKDLEKIESRVEMLMNGTEPSSPEDVAADEDSPSSEGAASGKGPELSLFDVED